MRKNKAIAIIAAICAVSIAGGVVGYTVGQRSEYMTIGAPHAIRDARGHYSRRRGGYNRSGL